MTRSLEGASTAADLQATASAADPSGIRRIDVWIQSALVFSVSSAGQIIGRPVVVRQLDSVINRMQQFHNEEWHRWRPGGQYSQQLSKHQRTIQQQRWDNKCGSPHRLKQRVKLLCLVSSACQVAAPWSATHRSQFGNYARNCNATV